jgi:hypothetical protein
VKFAVRAVEEFAVRTPVVERLTEAGFVPTMDQM